MKISRLYFLISHRVYEHAQNIHKIITCMFYFTRTLLDYCRMTLRILVEQHVFGQLVSIRFARHQMICIRKAIFLRIINSFNNEFIISPLILIEFTWKRYQKITPYTIILLYLNHSSVKDSNGDNREKGQFNLTALYMHLDHIILRMFSFIFIISRN